MFVRGDLGRWTHCFLDIGEMDLVEATVPGFVGVIEVLVSATGGVGVADLIVSGIDGMAAADEFDFSCMNNGGRAAKDDC